MNELNSRRELETFGRFLIKCHLDTWGIILLRRLLCCQLRFIFFIIIIFRGEAGWVGLGTSLLVMNVLFFITIVGYIVSFHTNCIIFRNVETFLLNFFQGIFCVKGKHWILRNFLFFEMKTSKLINYSTNMCQSCQGIRVFCRVTQSLGLLSPPDPFFSGVWKVLKFCLNLGNKCWNSAFNAQGSD